MDIQIVQIPEVLCEERTVKCPVPPRGSTHTGSQSTGAARSGYVETPAFGASCLID